MERIGVYCSSSVKIDKKYFDAAQQLGEWIGRNGKWLVYGGSDRGTMGTLATAAKQSGGRGVWQQAGMRQNMQPF